jgi:hypothetical protein
VTRVPDFRELVGNDVPADDEARLRQVHDLLVKAGPPPKLSRTLDQPPDAARRRRKWVVGLALAAALAACTFVAGYFVGGQKNDFEAVHSIPMHGVGSTVAAAAALDVAERDNSGNYSVLLRVRHLPPRAHDGYYVLYITLHGKPIATCGIFRTSPKGTAVARMTFPDDIGDFDGWTITPAGRAHEQQVLLTT